MLWSDKNIIYLLLIFLPTFALCSVQLASGFLSEWKNQVAGVYQWKKYFATKNHFCLDFQKKKLSVASKSKYPLRSCLAQCFLLDLGEIHFHWIIGPFRLERTAGGLYSSLLLKARSATRTDQVAQGFIQSGLSESLLFHVRKWCCSSKLLYSTCLE